MKIVIHQTHHQVADFDSIYETIKNLIDAGEEKKLHLFPELFLTGYPLHDLCLQASFIQKYHALLEKLNTLSLKSKSNETSFLMGGLKYEFDSNGVAQVIKNVIYELIPGRQIIDIYSKVLLPNYDIFDEKKYFTAGNETKIYEFEGKKLALQICEDMWPSTYHKKNPTMDLKNLGVEFDAVINLSASPFNLDKHESRHNRAREISHSLKCPFIYLNRVGAEDEVLFDGGSFVCNADEIVIKAREFEQDQVEFSLPAKTQYKAQDEVVKNTWDDLFKPNIHNNKLTPLNDSDLKLMQQALCFGLQEYASKCGFKKFTIALSGGMDSALVLALTKLSLRSGQSVEAIYMPSEFSSDLSLNLSQQMCEKLNIPFYVLPITGFHKLGRVTFEEVFSQKLEGLSDENIQSRMRGTLLYTRSNQIGSMVINTSNKSEIAVGYSTIYGDSVGAISLLGDVYKSEVYLLANYINKAHDNMIPTEIITRAPSAELRANQKDVDSLPPYDILDTILEGILSYRLSAKDLEDMGIEKKHIIKAVTLYKNSEYKRAQFPPIIKVKSKSFGFGYRVPISKNNAFYL